jgi:hypothetical protein
MFSAQELEEWMISHEKEIKVAAIEQLEIVEDDEIDLHCEVDFLIEFLTANGVEYDKTDDACQEIIARFSANYMCDYYQDFESLLQG